MFDEAKFEEALATPRLQPPVPEYLAGNRGGTRVRVLTEPELMAMTKQWFVEYEKKIALYAQHGIDIGWTLEWAKKYWWSWLMRDMSLNHELYTPDLQYTDVTSFGRTMVGLDEFVRYNFAFFDAIPDWRYDPLPGEVFIDLAPDGEVRVVVRYLGSGHWSGPLRLYPYDEKAPTIYGTGAFIQCHGVDRYYFNKDGLMYKGDTSYDIFEGLQAAGILPRDDSFLFKAMLKPTRLVGLWRSLRERRS
ncbi:MAG: nuclear transport factor 2 family protein [Actinobacteria bacterium]|nr:nuclear transport factor 2 family protein [Actinomycetota bacterium]